MSNINDANYFVLTDFVIIDTYLYNLPTTLIGPYLYLVKFQIGNLEHPKSEPIGVYYHAGIKRFMWRNKTYTIYNLNHRTITEYISKRKTHYQNRKLLDFIEHYSKYQSYSGEVSISILPYFCNNIYYCAIYETEN